jgi:hypothetical protein
LATAAVVLSFGLCLIALQRFKFPASLAFFYPLNVALFTLVAARSFVQTLRGTSIWKDRALERAAMRWL